MDADPKRGTLVRIPDSPTLKVGLGGMVIRRPLRAAFFSLILRFSSDSLLFPSHSTSSRRLLLSFFFFFCWKY